MCGGVEVGIQKQISLHINTNILTALDELRIHDIEKIYSIARACVQARAIHKIEEEIRLFYSRLYSLVPLG